MLSEFALSPAVFRTASYESADVADLCIRQMGIALREDCVVRDLCSGEWSRQLVQEKATLHGLASELLKKLDKQGRLAKHPLTGIQSPETDHGWEAEAISSRDMPPLTGCIFSRQAKDERYRKDPLVSCPEKLLSASFWTARTCSRRISRSIVAYMELLSPIFRHATDIMFIDPYIHPAKTGQYSDFWKLLDCELFKNRNPKPQIEIHRVAWIGESRNKTPKTKEILAAFRDHLEARCKAAGVSVNLYLWDDFHDRFLVTNLMGMSWSNGFDTSTNPSSSVTTTRLSRSDRDGVQNEFAANSTRHRLEGRFKIG